MIEFVFLDLDDTLFDFHRSEAESISQAFLKLGIVPSEENLALYSKINLSCWKRLETGELTRSEVLTRRFDILFSTLGISGNSHEAQSIYENLLGGSCYYIDGAEEVLQELRGKYRLFAATNGIVSVQSRRIASSGISRYFENIFISEEIGYNKPSREFFDYAFGRIDGFDKSRAIMVGDSPSSDIQGGINAGILTCYYNRFGRKNDTGIHSDVEIGDIRELPKILKQL